MIPDNEQTEIFDFYYATSYNSDVYVLDYGNNDTIPPKDFLSVIDVDLTQTSL